uniref:RING-type domain-containing protein n=1 Tax=Oryza punctata TaxID=4537 RepID=A0A0E0M1U6_ORYPU
MSTSAAMASRSPPPPPPLPFPNLEIWDHFFGPPPSPPPQTREYDHPSSPSSSATALPHLPLSRVASSSSSSSFVSTELQLPLPPPPPLLRRVPSSSSSWSSSFSTELLLLPPPPPPPFPLSPNSAAWRLDLDSSDYFISTNPDTPPHTGGLLQWPPRLPASSMYTSFVSDHRRGGSSSRESVGALANVTVSDAAAACAVCTDALQLASAASQLPCGHLYHAHCIVQWLSLRNTCPVCRRSVPMLTAASNTEETAPWSPPPRDDPQPTTTSTDHRRRSLPGERRIRRICRSEPGRPLAAEGGVMASERDSGRQRG